MPAFQCRQVYRITLQISRGQTLGRSAIPGCPGGSTGTSRPFASLRAKGAPLRGGSLLWTTWTIRRAVVKRSRQTEHQQIATGSEWQRQRESAAAAGYTAVDRPRSLPDPCNRTVLEHSHIWV